MKRTRVYVGLMLALLFALVTAVFAFGPRLDDEELFFEECHHPGPPRPPPAFPPRIDFVKFANLTQEQLGKIREIRDRLFTESRSLRYELLQKELEMRMLFSDPKADEAKLVAKQNELSALRQKLRDRIDRMTIEERRILTPEQIQKLDRTPLKSGRRGFDMMD